MFWYDETNRRQARDWRPEIHDSDGLAIWTGDGEHIWRPLNDPPQRAGELGFVDKDPKGFGLLQRDRNFENYEDDGVFYDRRPSVWVEPLERLGRGRRAARRDPDRRRDPATTSWRTGCPKAPVESGVGVVLRIPPALAGRRALSAEPRARDRDPRRARRHPRPAAAARTRRSSSSISPAARSRISRRATGAAIVDASRGTIDSDYVLQVVGTTHWRAFFDHRRRRRRPRRYPRLPALQRQAAERDLALPVHPVRLLAVKPSRSAGSRAA